MTNIYTAVYRCKMKESVGIPEYYDVLLGLGLPGDSRSTDIVIRGTCSSFVVGKEYVITISDMEFLTT